ncbi:astacin-like metalloprotease toxin 5 [Rhipicephalus sanguineus]|uniref:astacin-like metalloprotease toxin 5 n=1 Tax=Rhipicephalus sanguineus TaxID=34632 RepID=UPI00189487B8|nr:astacin-like metalloprotease toxin 5 [Rhipicephalus sanguineus]
MSVAALKNVALILLATGAWKATPAPIPEGSFSEIHPGTWANVRMIMSVIDSIEERTCIRFVPRSTQTDYVHLKHHEGCYSAIGRNVGVQTLSLGDGCFFFGTVTHEMMHAIGFYHEHSRPDRDDYIDIYPENVMPGQLLSFTKVNPSEIRLLTPFDYDSVMLYGSHAFSREPGLTTMLAKDGRWLMNVHEKPGLSESDVTRINTLYNCTI